MQYIVSILLVALSTTLVSASDKVQVDLYYESRCPDSIRFINQQLTPNWQSISSIVNLTLIPYGKANFQEHDNGKIEFSCQHGSEECLGNLYQNCAIEQAKNNFDFAILFINCMEDEARRFPRTKMGPIANQCAQLNKLNFESLENCATGTEGARLMKTAGLRTKAFRPAITFIPTVAINGKFNMQSLHNLVHYVCQAYNGPTVPEICQQFN